MREISKFKSLTLALISAFATVSLMPAALAGSQSKDLARALLQARCLDCHGNNGESDGDIGSILDTEGLIRRGLIQPGRPGSSKLVAVLKSGEMPASGPALSKIELAHIESWIKDMAPAQTIASATVPRIYTDADRLVALEKDLAGIPARNRKFYRYFAAGPYASAADRDEKKLALSKVMNSLSWGGEIVRPTPVGENGALYRIDLRDYRWTEKDWEQAVQVNPFVSPTLKDPTARQVLSAQTGTADPMLRLDWFVATAPRGKLYYDLLNLPGSQGDLEELLEVDVARNVAEKKVARAGFDVSGVSQNNRLMERHATKYGAYWRSLDYSGNTGSQDIFLHPLDSNPAGGEVIFNLPNGLQGYALYDARGNRLEKAPTEIVTDPARPDRAVENAISCVSCHKAGLIYKADKIRPYAEKNPGVFSPETLEEIRALHPKVDEMKKLIQADTDRYQRALRLTGESNPANDSISAVVKKFDSPLDLKAAASRLDLSVTQMLELIDASAGAVTGIGLLRLDGGSIRRDGFATCFGDLSGRLTLGDDNRPKLPEGPRFLSATYGCDGNPVDALVDLLSKCGGQETCQYTVNANVLGDPCRFVAKQFHAKWTCKGSDKTFTFDSSVTEDANTKTFAFSCPKPLPAGQAPGIRILSATYGANCGATAGNATSDVTRHCGIGNICDYRVDVTRLGDVCPNIAKDFTVSWVCDNDPKVRARTFFGEASGEVARLECL